MTVSLVVVGHRSSSVLADCIASFRSEALAASVAGEVVVIEQSEDPAEAERIAGLGADQLVVRPNRGYAAGLNAGIAAASGSTLLLANPDTVFCAGSLKALLEAIAEGFDVVGPQLVWDDAGEILFPPAEDPRWTSELWRTLRSRRQWAWDAGLHGVLDEWWRVWSAARPVEVAALRGPLLAASRAAVERLGPLDEGYFMYCEDTDWCHRLGALDYDVCYVPAFEVVHHVGASRASNPEASYHYYRSLLRYFLKYRSAQGAWIRAMMLAGFVCWGLASEAGSGSRFRIPSNTTPVVVP